MKKFLISLLVITLLLITFWPSNSDDSCNKLYSINSVIDGNTVRLDNGTTVHLIGVSNTNEGKDELDRLVGEQVRLVADSSNPFNHTRIGKRSTVYAYIILDGSEQGCINANLIKERCAEIQEETFLVDSLDAFRKYTRLAKKKKRETPTPARQNVIDYNQDDIKLPNYAFDSNRRHSKWYVNGNMNIDMLKEACDYNLPYTKSFANQLAAKAPGAFNFKQVCEIFNYCYKNWSYVNDPKNDEYVARASESIASSLSGDCDDFAILMASCIIAVGGDIAITSAYNSDSGHAYTELNITDMDINEITETLKEMYPHISLDEVVTRTDQYGVWLNLDWQANYPGGPYWEANERNVYYRNGLDWKWVKYE